MIQDPSTMMAVLTFGGTALILNALMAWAVVVAR